MIDLVDHLITVAAALRIGYNLFNLRITTLTNDLDRQLWRMGVGSVPCGRVNLTEPNPQNFASAHTMNGTCFVFCLLLLL